VVKPLLLNSVMAYLRFFIGGFANYLFVNENKNTAYVCQY